jgi:hypothetical protein
MWSILRRNPVNNLVWMSMFVNDKLRRSVRENFCYYSLNVHGLYKSSSQLHQFYGQFHPFHLADLVFFRRIRVLLR